MTAAASAPAKFPLRARCRCRARSTDTGGALPIRVFEAAAVLLRQALGGTISPLVANLPVQDYRCPECKEIVVVRLGDFLGVSAAEIV